MTMTEKDRDILARTLWGEARAGAVTDLPSASVTIV